MKDIRATLRPEDPPTNEHGYSLPADAIRGTLRPPGWEAREDSTGIFRSARRHNERIARILERLSDVDQHVQDVTEAVASYRNVFIVTQLAWLAVAIWAILFR